MSTVTHTFTWDAALEGFHVSSLGAATLGWFFGDGDPSPGCLQIRANDGSSGTCDLVNSSGLTWETLGVPAGATVTRVALDWHAKNLHPIVSPSTHNTLELDLQSPTGASVIGSPVSKNLTLYTTSWGTDGGGTSSVDPAYGPSIQPIVISLHHIYTAADGDIEVHFDTLTLTITYGDPVTGGGGDPDPTPDPAPTPTSFGGCPCDRTVRDVPTAFETHLQGECLTLAQCLRMERQDGEVFGFTSFDQDLTVDGVTYLSLSGLQASALRQELGGGVDNLDLTGLLLTDAVTDTDLRAGLYDSAVLTLTLCNWADPTQFLTLLRGVLGEVHITDGRYTAEFRSLAQRLAQTVGETYSPLCRVHQLGDVRCAPGGLFADGKTLADYQFSRTVSAVTDTRRMTFGSDTHPTDYYTYGRVLFTDGPNSGIAREIKKHTLTGGAAVIELQEGFPFTVTIGDGATLEAGCDRTVTTCHDRFANTLNMRAEPFLQGWHRLKRRGKKR